MAEVSLQAEGVPGRPMSPIRYLRQVWQHVIVDPIGQGRLRDVGWPPGLRLTVIIGYLGLAVASLLVVLAIPLRRLLPLALVDDAVTIPRLAVGVLMLLVALTLTVFLLACAHGPRWLLVVGTLIAMIGLAVTSLFAIITASGWSWLVLLLVVLFLAVPVLVVVFRHRGFGAWQFPLLYGVVLGIIILVAADSATRGAPLGYDLLPAILASQITLLTPLASPLIFAAGTAPAEVAVTLSLRASALLGRGYRRSVTYTAMTLALLVAGGLAGWQVISAGGLSLPWETWATTLVVLLGCVAAAGGIIRAAGARAWRSDEVADVGASLGWPSGAVVFGSYVPLMAVLFVPMFLSAFFPSLAWAYGVIGHPWTVPALRLAACLAAAGVAWWSVRRGHPVRASVLACAAIAMLPLALSTILDQDHSLTVDLPLLGGVVLAGAAVWTIVLAVRRRLTETRAVGVLALAVLVILIPFRQTFAEPVEFLLGQGVAIILFGLWWQLFTASEVGNRSSDRFRLAPRVLLLLTSILLTVIALAYNSLTRQPAVGGMEAIVDLGDATLGVGIIAAAVAGVLSDIRRDRLPT